ncbi:hypothetical protein C0993_004439 [Termitomyces sp. T159_Od127]|nr:hypothetical protein C0993_004439 [Termitomyces sp. T159_Od127]
MSTIEQKSTSSSRTQPVTLKVSANSIQITASTPPTKCRKRPMALPLPLYHPLGRLALSLPPLDPASVGLPIPARTGDLIRSPARVRRPAGKVREVRVEVDSTTLPLATTSQVFDTEVKDKPSPRKRKGGAGAKRRRREVDDGDATYPAKRPRMPRGSNQIIADEEVPLESSIPEATPTPEPLSEVPEDRQPERRATRSRVSMKRRDSSASDAPSSNSTGAIGPSQDREERREEPNPTDSEQVPDIVMSQQPSRDVSVIDEKEEGELSDDGLPTFVGHAVLPAGSRFSEGAGVAQTTAAGVVPPAASGTQTNEGSDQRPAPQQPTPTKPFYKKRWFIISSLILIPLGIALLFIILFPVVRAIIQLVIKRTQLEIDTATISHPQNDTFQLSLQGNVTHTGIISSRIEFPEPVEVSWFENEFTETKIGTVTFDTLFAKDKRASINATSNFMITDGDAFGRFSTQLITSSNFTWRLKSSNLKVQALKFPVAKGLSFDKNVTMQGFNSFDNNVILKDLQLPSDNPAGGINFVAVTQLNNPSPFSINLGTVVFELSYKNVSLGTGTGKSVIVPGANDITLSGFMKHQSDPGNLALVSELFTNYLNGESSPVEAMGKSTVQDDNSSVSWLNQGLQSLTLNVPFKAFQTINPIQSISIGSLALEFDENSPWTPGAKSNSVQASLKLPFGFNLAIDEIQNDFTIVTLDGAHVADVQLTIAGFSGSTKIASLVDAFETLNIDVVLPGLKENLIDTAALEILSTTGRSNNISHVKVSLSNPFSTPLEITKISSTVSSFGILLGNIESNVDFKSAANSTTESPTMDLNMNFDPAALFTVTRALAVEAGMDVDPLDAVVDLGGIKYLSITGEPPKFKHRANIFDGFNLPNFVNTAFKKLQSDVALNADVTIGDYKTALQYTQSSVPTMTDKSLDLILPVLAQPIVQQIVGGSSLGISTVLITDPKQNSFGTQMKGNIGNAGPFDAVISFPSGLTVSWAGKPLGNIKLGDVKVTGNVGGTIDATSSFEVADVAHLTDFTKTLLTEESFEWQISAQNVSVSALGISVPNIVLNEKTVTLKGFNGLKGGVTIKTFDLPSNDPSGGIHLTLEATTTNPSQVGIALSSIGFDTFAGDIMIAPVLSTGAVSLMPGSTSDLSLVGRLIPQSSAAGLSTVSGIFNNFVHGKDSNVEVRGASAGPKDVTWLNEGIKSLRIATIFPNRGAQQIIKTIGLNELQLLFTEDTAYSPLASSRSTDAAFTLPFGFPLDITALEQTINIGFEGTSFAQLVLPKAPSKTDVSQRIIHLTFDNVPFAVSSDQHSTFDKFLAATTIGKTQTIHLSGSANADARTAVGLLTLDGITFSLDSSVEGLQGLNAKPVLVNNVEINHGFPDYLLIKVDSTLFNPSNLTIGTGDVDFSLQFEDQTIGMAEMSNLVIKPGSANYSIDVHYAPQGGAVSAGRDLLQNFVQGVDVDTTIAGTSDSTAIPSLKSALSQIRLSPVSIPALHSTLIKSVSLTFPTDIVKTGVASSTFTLANPFTASINLLKVGATATYHGIQLGKINSVDVSSNPIHANGHSTVTSPNLPLEYNLDPMATIQLLSIASQQNGVDLGPLTQLFQFVISNPDFKPPVCSIIIRQAPSIKNLSGCDFGRYERTEMRQAFNGLPGVTISNFKLPSDDPAGGIHIETDTLIPSPAQLGIDLGTVTFQSFFQDTLVGRKLSRPLLFSPLTVYAALSGNDLFLAPGAKTTSHLSGRMLPQTGKDLDNMGILFSNFLAGKDQTLITKGDSVQPSGSDGPVTWLSTAFKSLSLEVTLPGQKSDASTGFNVIQSIALNDLAVTLDNQDQAFAPPTSSHFTLVKYKNPFGFSLQVIEVGQTLILNGGGVDIAKLTTPKTPAVGGVSTGNDADLVVSFENVPLEALNQAAFAQMFAGVTLQDVVDLNLKGTSDVTAKTAIGNVAISGVEINVPSSLKGFNSFGHTAALSNVSIQGSGGAGGSEYIVSPLTTILQNPSNVTLDTVDVSLPVIFSGTKLGRAVINPLHLVPGKNPSAAEFRYQPDNANDTTAQTYAAFTQHFDSFVVPPGQTVNSGTVPNVLLVQGAMASLGIIPLGELDVAAASTLRIGQGGYQIPWLKLNQKAVPTTYNLALTMATLKEKAQEIHAASSSSSLATESKTTAPEATTTVSTEESKTSSAGSSAAESSPAESVAKLTTEPSATASASAASDATSVAPTASETSSS